MSTEFQVVGVNSKAPFTLKIHRGDGMVLLAMNWRNGRPPRDFVGFAIEFREPDSNKFWAVRTASGFPASGRNRQIRRLRAPGRPFRSSAGSISRATPRSQANSPTG